MGTHELVMQILAGGFLGMLGQGVRAVAGMKKIHDTAAASGQSFGEVFEGSQLLASMVVGFTAGVLALFAAGGIGAELQIDRSIIVTIAAAGYSGTDFIEAFMSRAKPPAAPAAVQRDPWPPQPPAVG
jgi:hypothetical protein